MTKKLIIFISVGLGVVLLVLIGYVLLSSTSKTGSSGTGSGFRGFFPFGGNNNTSTENSTADTGNNQSPFAPQQQNYQQKLRELSTEPVAGAGSYDTKQGTVIRFIEKATGHMYDIEMFSPNVTRISNTTVPVVYDAIWGSQAKTVITRYLKDDNQTIDTYALTVQDSGTTTDKVVNGIQFLSNIPSVDVSGNSVFYLLPSGNGTIGIISDMSGSKKKQIWSSPLRELNVQYVNNSTVALTTKPEVDLPGYTYLVNINTGVAKRAVGDIDELSTLVSPDSNLVLGLANSTTMFLQKISDGTQNQITPATFPEKCVWSKKDTSIMYCAVPNETLDSSSLISWYKGLISYTDQIWKYDLKNNTSVVVENFSNDTDQAIDVIKPVLSDSEQYLFFINKRDGSLWSLDLAK